MSQTFVSSWLVSEARLMFCPRQSLGYHDYITPMMMEIWWDHQFVLNITLSTAPSAYIITSHSVLTLHTRTSRAPHRSGVPAPKISSHQKLVAAWLVLVTSAPQEIFTATSDQYFHPMSKILSNQIRWCGVPFLWLRTTSSETFKAISQSWNVRHFVYCKTKTLLD